MTKDKERLDEIKDSKYSILEIASDLKNDWEWLIEQANRFEILSEQNDLILKQNKRYREALWNLNLQLKNLFVEVWDIDQRKLQGEFYKMSEIIQRELEADKNER